LARYIQDRICAVGQEYEAAFPSESGLTIEPMVAKVLPADDRAIRFRAVMYRRIAAALQGRVAAV
jgi:hypothetical protein